MVICQGSQKPPKRQVSFAGHCTRYIDAPQPVQFLVFWESPAKFIRSEGAAMAYLWMMKNRLGIDIPNKEGYKNDQKHWGKALP